MGRIVFLLEEPSMVECLRGILPKVFPSWVENVDWVPIPHKGKSDLHKSIPRKLSAWREPNVRFVILRDNDSGDCIALKAHLRKLANARSEDEVLIRIVCQELESRADCRQNEPVREPFLQLQYLPKWPATALHALTNREWSNANDKDPTNHLLRKCLHNPVTLQRLPPRSQTYPTLIP